LRKTKKGTRLRKKLGGHTPASEKKVRGLAVGIGLEGKGFSGKEKQMKVFIRRAGEEEEVGQTKNLVAYLRPSHGHKKKKRFKRFP